MLGSSSTNKIRGIVVSGPFEAMGKDAKVGSVASIEGPFYASVVLTGRKLR